MLSAHSVFVGVDPTAAHKSFTYAALDRELNVLELAEADLDEIVELLAGKSSATVAINSPSHVNTGVLRRSMEAKAALHQLRGVDIRMAEHELRKRGIPVSGTPARAAACAPWVQAGLALYSGLSARGFEPYPAEGCTHRVLETHPHAAFCVLIGRAPLSKPSLEGRLQRQLALVECGMRLRDPMGFFEEITRHKLLNGLLPLDLLYTPEQLDALVAAYTAWVAAEKRAMLTQLGAVEEGFVYLPTGEMKEKYQ